MNCLAHNREIIFVDLDEQYSGERFGCEKCFLAHDVREIVFLKDLKWTDAGIEKFIESKSNDEVDKSVDVLAEELINDLSIAKKEVMIKRIQGKRYLQKQAKKQMNQYQQAFSIRGLREIIKDYLQGKLSEEQVSKKVDELTQTRSELEDLNKKGKIQTNYPVIQKEDVAKKEKELKEVLQDIQTIIKFSKNWGFVRSVLSKNCFCNIVQKENFFEFNDQDSWQLVYGTQRMKEGKFEWEIQIENIESKGEQEEEEKKEQQSELVHVHGWGAVWRAEDPRGEPKPILRGDRDGLQEGLHLHLHARVLRVPGSGHPQGAVLRQHVHVGRPEPADPERLQEQSQRRHQAHLHSRPRLQVSLSPPILLGSSPSKSPLASPPTRSSTTPKPPSTGGPSCSPSKAKSRPDSSNDQSNNQKYIQMKRTSQSAANLMEKDSDLRKQSAQQDDTATKPLQDISHLNKTPRVNKLIPIASIFSAYKKIKHVATRTPLYKSNKLSEKFEANIYFKREDLQVVRSYKLRGAYNKIMSLSDEQRKKGIVCASAGNHAQGVSYVCNLLKIQSRIFMPTNTPGIKLNAVKSWGKQYCEVELACDTFDDCFREATKYCKEHNMVFVHAFDDEKIIEGAASIGIEILEDIPEDKIDILFFPIGGGGVGAGITSYFKQISPETVLIGCEPEGSPSMKNAIQNQKIEELDHINTFVDGAAIKKAGCKTYEILNEVLKDVTLVSEGHICTVMMKLFNEDGILVEPAGALTIAALDQFRAAIKGRTVVCLISGSNNDLGRMQDIRMLSDMHKGLQYYLFINFFMKPGALKQFITECLGQHDEITNIEYTKKNNREKGPALVGLHVRCQQDMEKIQQKMDSIKLTYRFLDPNQEIFKLLL